MVSKSDVWAVGNAVANTPAGPLIEHFDGTAWQIVPGPTATASGVLLSISAISSSDVWAVGYATVNVGAGTSESVVLHFDGLSWTMVQLPQIMSTGSFLHSIKAIPSGVYVAGATARLFDGGYVFRFDGSTWNVELTTSTQAGLSALAASAADNVWAGGSFDLERWDGSVWSQVSRPSFIGSVATTAPTSV